MKESSIDVQGGDYQGIPQEILKRMYMDQLNIMETWGISIPEDEEILSKDCPLCVKVNFLDWLIQEAMEYKYH